jgi:fatty-acyl-CoA synthase
VIAIPDAKWSERPLACVVFRAVNTATAEDLRAHLAHKFA